MILIFGGAYQGKLNYALEHYNPAASVCQCNETETRIDFSKEIINSFHYLILAQLRNEMNPYQFVNENIELLKPKIIICNDISCGVVSVDGEMRLWREFAGRILTLLAKHADEVVRVFCGLGTKIK
ncbi:MAG: bifunctional adenosylcobinamide kinase/adenosylcobinamide-phosphate guanylyltransferase [Planctomycetaceae bacterium]|jgi:adenosyl cobinamide kinase/adenosyl cobinamide phosphate guanylyltransferase|nr:bifunctional adenosylcobinamide kinase/adenosylcobinamide-phosphate guanylyltransferase [Planctomycetaceae bacterium]